ncbi:MAG: hypothetical protein QCH99_08510 [Candidatus Bathyarchaeota archaeon]|nr:hypothetical protein [Candidatus Bathyarchaeum tardum]
MKTEGSITDYRTRTVRAGKFHYGICIRIVLTADQVTAKLTELLNKILEYSGMINGK